ncbi:MAG: cupin domain-containing protein [Chitinophagaceae bacterium]|nr:cupin domain-containing protein [Chitinophagaceae bacterium]
MQINLNEMNVFIENDAIEWEQVANGVRRKIMVYDERLMLVKVAFEAGATGTLHHHYHTQITHVECGVFEVQINGEKRLLRQGDAFYIPPDVEHGVVCMEKGMLIDVFHPLRKDFIE